MGGIIEEVRRRFLKKRAKHVFLIACARFSSGKSAWATNEAAASFVLYTSN